MSTIRFLLYSGWLTLFFSILAIFLPVELCAGFWVGLVFPALCRWLNVPIDFSSVQVDYYHTGTRIPWNGEGDYYIEHRNE